MFEHVSMPPTPENCWPVVEVSLERPFDRRTLLAGAIGCGLASDTLLAFAQLDQTLPGILYSNDGTRIVPVGGSAFVSGSGPQDMTHYTRRVWFSGGIGQDSSLSRPLAERLAKAPYKWDDMNYSAYSQQGLDVTQITDEFERFSRTTDKIDAFTNSMSLLTLCNMAAEIDHRRQTTSGAAPEQLTSLTLCSSPTSVKDVYYGEVISAFVETFRPQGTMSQKFVVKALDKFVNHGRRDISKLVEEAAGEVFDRLSPKLWVSQLYQVVYTDALKLARNGKLNSLIGPRTRLAYVLPDADRVVNAWQACETVEEIARIIGCHLDVFILRGAGHADIGRLAGDASYQAWVDEDKLVEA